MVDNKKEAKNCKNCKLCKRVYALDSWWFYGCHADPNQGKACFELKECPLTNEEYINSRINKELSEESDAL